MTPSASGLYGLDLEAGDRFELSMHLAYETGVVASLPAICGAPRQNRTAITGLQNQCTAIVLVGLMLSPQLGLNPTDH